jgi:hypothetical protein
MIIPPIRTKYREICGIPLILLYSNMDGLSIEMAYFPDNQKPSDAFTSEVSWQGVTK